ncbi:unnamed protein product [Rhizophagus irregularis]|nr:unnamed protein product [Rhizophagus irregularis]
MKICKICGYGNYSNYYRWCKCRINHLRENFKNWTSGNEEVDKLIQEMQLKIDSYSDIVFEWIPYDQLDDIKGNSMSRSCLAMWKDGPLFYEFSKKEYTRSQNKNITLKSMTNSQNIAVEIKSYSIGWNTTDKIFGISQNPDTKDYGFVLEDEYCIKCGQRYKNIVYKWCSTCKIQYSRNVIINKIIQKIQFKIDSHDIFEWIPYNQFDNIEEMDKDDSYTALWKEGSLQYDNNKNEYVRIQNKKVALKYIYGGSQNIINEFNEIKNHSDRKIYGISQDLNIKKYIIVFEDRYCENYCADENEKIDHLIQEMQLKNDHDSIIVFEWIPYNQFNNIKEMVVYDFTKIYLAVWENGPSYHNSKDKYIRNKNRNKKVKLKSLCNLQNITDEFLNVVCNFLINLVKYFQHN